MTENIPPIPPTPQAPDQAPPYPPAPPEGYGQPVFQAPPQVNQPQYAAPSGYPGPPQTYGQPQATYPPQGYAGPGPYAQPQSGSYYQLPGQWVPATPTRPKSSGNRVASGVIEIVLGLWLIVPTSVMFSRAPFLGFLFLIAFLGNITAGIILLVKHRGHTPAAPLASLALAGFAALLSLISVVTGYYGAAIPVFTLPLAVPILIVMGLGLAKEKRGL